MIVRFRHATLDRWIRLEAIPDPCQDEEASCRWTRQTTPLKVPSHYRFQDIIIPEGHSLIIVVPEDHRWDSLGGNFRLPRDGVRINARRTRRYPSSGVKAELIQDGIRFEGRLIDFSSLSLRVDLELGLAQSFSWICSETPLMLILSDDQGTVFAGNCRLIRGCRETASLLLEPLSKETQRFARKSHRSGRVIVTPAPNLIFNHPLIGRRFEVSVLDLSGTGLSIQTPLDQDVLLPGLIIRHVRLVFSGGTALTFRAQVIYSNRIKSDGLELMQCGLAILDISPRAHTQLLSMLYQVKEPNAYIDHPQDMEALWRFFFETGFIYPSKYVFFHKFKKCIQATYEKLYRQHPDIARHFTYQRMGRVLGHMAMLRFYRRAWMIQHHAANTRESHRAGLIVLEQIGRFINDSHRLGPICMDYVFCLYRPENKFPSRVFGSAAKSIADPQICSTDTFAYLHFTPQPLSRLKPAGPGWRLTASSDEDLAELEAAYIAHSGNGGLIRAFDLKPGKQDMKDLSGAYQSIGLMRQRLLYTLRRDDCPAAVLMCNRSDFGLNMSDLTNCVQIFVIDSRILTPDILHRAISRIADWYNGQKFPIMIYPEEAASRCAISAEKRYTAWVLDLDYTDRYFDYVSRLINIAAHRKARKE